MEHSIFLDLEKINLIRDSLNVKFKQIDINNEGVVIKIIQWLEEFFSFHEDLKNNIYIINENRKLEIWFYNLNETKPWLRSYEGEEENVLSDKEYKIFKFYIAYFEIKNNLQKKNKSVLEDIINEFYMVKLPLLEPIYSSLIKGISVKLTYSNNYELHFVNLKNHINEFYFKNISDKSIVKENLNYNPNELDCYPFQNLEIKNFFLHIEKITTRKTKIFYSYLREFLSSNNMFLDSNLNKQNYYDWINKKNNLTGNKIVEYQHNLSSQRDYEVTFLSELTNYEKTIKPIRRIE
jgi:hypothetical protein